jgi:hypothetical protein
MNPTFGHIDWTGCGPGITRADNMILRVWLRRGSTRRWQQLLRLTIDMQGLQYMGKTVRALPHSEPVFELTLSSWKVCTASSPSTPSCFT